jgi:multisubunit Na+/H+ antiporter MnhG subunit
VSKIIFVSFTYTLTSPVTTLFAASAEYEKDNNEIKNNKKKTVFFTTILLSKGK